MRVEEICQLLANKRYYNFGWILNGQVYQVYYPTPTVVPLSPKREANIYIQYKRNS